MPQADPPGPRAEPRTGAVARLLAGPEQRSLEDHLSQHGPPPFADIGRGGTDTAALITAVERAGLTGRGGAGFPAGRKMRAVTEAARHGGPFRSQTGTVVIANGAESEPASAKDRRLLSHAPHLVLDGIVLAAEAVGATRAYLCVHGGPEMLRDLREAVVSRERAGLSRVPVQVVSVPAGYVTSQETALVGLLNGTGARPSFVPPRPAQRGVQRHPTLVLNVETLACVALIARHGPAWFRELGTPAAPGSALFTISGAVTRPGVYELALGSTIGRALEEAGGPAEPPQAVLAGGYFGGWLPLPAARRAQLTDQSLRTSGAALGPGVLVVLPQSSCPLAEMARVTSYLASQSAGQCGPCRNGLPALADALGHVAFGRPGEDLLRWTDQLLGLVSGRGACHLPDGTAGLVASALAAFSDDVRQHARHGPCGRAARPPVLPLPEPPPVSPVAVPSPGGTP
ncbi:MAG TPA: NADH-ubiquinone oxidoreductase-F iron-sulfur binding region domain-containing protein [Streptosporangiaceae bacterium]|nr:NADH-ubiquinone oxidoreductase-F iron-sulfur binding region domain-containing protein [Streptosporangiaceae bacterium]